jgi:transposase
MNPLGVRGYSLDLKSRIVARAKTGMTPNDVAEHFSVDPSTVRRYLQKDRQGTLALPPPLPGRPPIMTAGHEAQLLSQLNAHRDATLQEHADLLCAATGVRVSFKTVDRVFRKYQVTHKKNAGRQRAE